jgi:hypothetical protein
MQLFRYPHSKNKKLAPKGYSTRLFQAAAERIEEQTAQVRRLHKSNPLITQVLSTQETSKATQMLVSDDGLSTHPNSHSNSEFKDILLLSLVYSIAYGLMLLNDGLFWDDWVSFGKSPGYLLNLSQQWGNIYLGYYTSNIFSSPDTIYLGRMLVFLFYLLSALFLFQTLKGIKEIDADSRFILVLLFIIIPVNNARIALCCSFMAIGYVLFFLGLWLITKYMSGRNIFLRLATLMIFFASFSVLNSLLPFYLLVLGYIIYADRISITASSIDRSITDLFIQGKRYADFILLPLVFWTVKAIFLTPFGLYEGYNAITVGNLLLSPFRLVFSFYSTLIDVLIESLVISLQSLLLWALLFLIVIAIIRFRYTINEHSYDSKLFLLGIILFSIGVFPYLVVGKVPTMIEWNTRHQLLVPLGMAFILYYGLNLLSEKTKLPQGYRKILLSLMLAMFLCANIVTYADYQRDWYKQTSLIENFKASEIMRNNNTFLFDDHTRELNANNRSYRFYEYTGMMRAAFGDESRLGCDWSSFEGLPYYEQFSAYNLENYSGDNPTFIGVTVEHGDLPFGLADLPKLMYHDHFRHEQFDKDIPRAIKLSFTNLGKNLV